MPSDQPPAKDAKAAKKNNDKIDPPKERSVEEIDAEIWDKTLKDSLASHGGWLGSLVLQSSSAGASYIPMLLVIGLTLFTLLCALPPNATCHLSAALTLVIPLQNTLRAIALSSKASSKDSAQWLQYWVVYTVLGMAQGWLGIVRPHWRWLFEIWKTVVLVVLAGPWFGRQLLLPEKTSLIKERSEAEERKRKQAKAKAQEDAAKAKKEDEKRRKEKEKQEKQRAKEKAKREEEKKKAKKAAAALS